MESPDFYSIFAAAPAAYLLLAADSGYTILAVNDAYLAATLTKREQLVGAKLFDSFPDNPSDPSATGVSNLRTSLEHVLRFRAAHTMAIQKYDIRRPDGTFGERHWSPVNTPVFGADGTITSIINQVQDVSEFVRPKSSRRELERVSEALRQESQRADDTGRQLLDVERQLQASDARQAEFEQRLRAEAALRESEARFRALTTATSDVLYRMSADWSEMQPLDGRALVPSNDEPIRDWLQQNVPPSEHDAVRAAIANASATRGMFELEHRVFRPDGTIGWTLSRAVPIVGADHQIVEWFGAATDITDRKHIEDRLRTSEERLALAVNAAQIGTFYCPLPLGELIWNDKCKEHFWLPLDAEVSFDIFRAIIHPDDRDRVQAAIERSIFGREGYDTEYRTIAPDGRQRWVRAMGRAYYDAGGEPTRFDGVTLDVTDVKRLEEELRRVAEERRQLLEAERQARTEAERASQMKDEFLATLSHELRTPLNAILGWSQILQIGSSDAEELRQGLDTISRNARSQTQIIEDLLDMSRIVSGKVRLDVQPVDLSTVVAEAVATLRPAAEAKGIRLQAVLGPAAGPVSGDASRLQQVFWNLLTNSVKFTPKGGRVQVLLERVDSHLEVSVADTGEGIAAEFLPHVFDRFRQADASTTRRHGGLGLGLAIVKQLIELHGGTVHASSQGIGKGATFRISLPLTPLQTEDDAEQDRRQPNVRHDGPRPLPPKLIGVRVLVVDDESDSRAVVKQLLEHCDAAVAVAGSVSEAMKTFDGEGRFHVIVSDIGMAERDGYDLIRAIRSLPVAAGGKTPAVALTAYARSDDRTRAILAGFDMHIVKPVEPSELCAAVARLAGRAE